MSTPNAETSDVLDVLAQGARNLAHLTGALDVAISHAGRWISEPQNVESVRNLVAVLEAQTQLILAQQRVLAVAKLAELLTTAKSPETVRRVCMDLLTIQVPGWQRASRVWEEEAESDEVAAARKENLGSCREQDPLPGDDAAASARVAHRRAQTNPCFSTRRARADCARPQVHWFQRSGRRSRAPPSARIVSTGC